MLTIQRVAHRLVLLIGAGLALLGLGTLVLEFPAVAAVVSATLAMALLLEMSV